MKLMTYLGIALAFSLPAKAVYVDGGIDCSQPGAVVADAVTQLDFWEVYWGGWVASSAIVEIDGASGYASGYGYGWELEPAVAYASIGNPAAGTYQFFAWHDIYSVNWGWYYLANFITSCDVQGGGGGGGGDPTPSISYISPGVWNAGQPPLAVQIVGSGFGDNSPSSPYQHLSMSGTGVNYTLSSWSDTSILAYVTVDANAPDETVYVEVTSTGYNGMGFQQQPGGQGPTSPTATAQVQGAQGGCGDERDTLIQQYLNYGVNLMPDCNSFTNSAQSEYFSYGELTVNSGASSWAIIQPSLTVAKSSGYGLDRWRQLIGAPQYATSAYRTPAHNSAIDGATQSRHMYGDAVDLANETHTEAEYDAKYAAAVGAQAGYIEPLSGPCKLGCVHADWRNYY